ncbi:MAG: CHAT domain-containing protein [Saprospiraceae bacterium]
MAVSSNINTQLLAIDTSNTNILIEKADMKLLKIEYDSAAYFYLKAKSLLEPSIFNRENVDTFLLKQYWQIKGNLARTYNGKKMYQKTIDLLKHKLLVNGKDISFPCAEILKMRMERALALFYQPDYEKAKIAFTDAASTASQIDSLKGLASINHNISLCFLYRGMPDSTLYYTNKNLQISKQQKDTTNLIKAYNLLGHVSYSKGAYQEAIETFQLALNISEALNIEDDDNIPKFLANIGVGFMARGDFDESLNYYEKAVKVINSYTNALPIYLSNIYNNIGIIHREKGDYSRALENYEWTLSTLEKELPAGNYRLGEINSNIGALYIYTNQYEQSLKYLKNAQTIFEGNPQNYDKILGNVYTNLGVAYSNLKITEKASYYLNKGLQKEIALKGSHHPEVADVYRALAEFYYDINEFSSALEVAQKAINIYKQSDNQAHSDLARSYLSLGQNYLRQNALDSALLYFNKGIARLIPDFETEDIYAIPALNKNIFAKLVLIELLRFKVETIWEKYKIEKTDFYLSNALKNIDLATQYIDLLRLGLQREGSKLELNNLSQVIYNYGVQLNVLAAKKETLANYIEKAFNFSERNRVSLLLESINLSQAKHFSKIPTELLEKERQNKLNIAYYEKVIYEERLKEENEDKTKIDLWQQKLFDLKQVKDSLSHLFQSSHSDYYALTQNQKIVSIESIQSNFLGEKNAFLEYFISDSTIYAFVIQKEKYSIIEIPKASLFTEKIKALQKGVYTYHIGESRSSKLYKRYADTLVEAAFYLHQQLIAPIKAEVNLPNELIIVPDGVLGYIPFELLISNLPNDNTLFHNHAYLLKEHQISYAYSATLLEEMLQRRHKAKKNNFLAFAPSFRKSELIASNIQNINKIRTGLSSLHYNIPEVKAIQQLLGGKIYINENATEANFLKEAPNYNIIHLSTHGKANDKIGDYAYLAFSEIKDTIENEFLYNRDLYNLQLNADMVVLSACETGVGELQKGEGIISLARGFSYAGAKSIITTLWSVNDAKTKVLMENFYGYIKAGRTKDDALRQAKIDLMENNPDAAHPFYWAAFVPIGDMSPIEFQETISVYWLLGILGVLGFIIFLFLSRCPYNLCHICFNILFFYKIIIFMSLFFTIYAFLLFFYLPIIISYSILIYYYFFSNIIFNF